MRLLLKLLLVISLSALSPVSQAQADGKISTLGELDIQYMAHQRKLVDDIVRRRFGRQFNGILRNDLELLQWILDRRLIAAEETAKLQAMGVIMGDLLATELDMDWVIYKDQLGRSRALHDNISGELLFPITMISRRAEVGNRRPVAEIYQKAVDIITDVRPVKPYDVKPPGTIQ